MRALSIEEIEQVFRYHNPYIKGFVKDVGEIALWNDLLYDLRMLAESNSSPDATGTCC